MAEQFDNELNSIQIVTEAQMFLLYKKFFEYKAISRGTQQW